MQKYTISIALKNMQYQFLNFYKQSEHQTSNLELPKDNVIGILWLIKKFNIEPVLPVYIISSIGTRRKTSIKNDFTHQIYQSNMMPENTVIAHLQFHLRHEIVHLEFLKRIFDHIDSKLIQNWVNNEPTGRYARRYAFLYDY